jgi:hypothetical protein
MNDNKQQLFNIFGNASFYADNEQHAYEKLGKYFLSKAKGKPYIEILQLGKLELLNLTEIERQNNE